LIISVVYVCRNPNDAAVSYYKFHDIIAPEIEATFEEFIPLFKLGKLQYGSYWYHLKVNELYCNIMSGTSIQPIIKLV
jgi:hypothetical protein